MKLAIVLLAFVVAASAENRSTSCARWYQIPANRLEIACPAAHTVVVDKAFYGYWQKSSSSDRQCSYTPGDCTEDAMHIAIAHCHGKTRCSFPVEKSLMSHSLSWLLNSNRNQKCGSFTDRLDYMEVIYHCQAISRGATIVASDCTNLHTINEAPHERLENVLDPLRHVLLLECPPDQKIRVREAFYGWWKDNRNQGCRFHQDDCKVASQGAFRCNGRQTCDVQVNRSSTHNDCGGFHLFSTQVDHHDYFQVNYQCLEEK